MSDQRITYETATLLKEKGFKIPSNWAYLSFKGETITPLFYEDWGDILTDVPDTKFIAHAPTQNQLQKWLREQHGYHVFVEPQSLNDSSLGWTANGHTLKSFNVTYRSFMPRLISSSHDTYEEALESGLLTVLTDIV